MNGESERGGRNQEAAKTKSAPFLSTSIHPGGNTEHPSCPKLCPTHARLDWAWNNLGQWKGGLECDGP